MLEKYKYVHFFYMKIYLVQKEMYLMMVDV